ncbi:hypothetical protein [Pantoea sp. SORGH_AS_0659]|uniref:hypothetical protein n=1 Tax=Pantoea sp. SORGH_AS_0659 TaxID=3062597 RepID=UPI002854D8D1|nr:hypothetical protein [Pantoea sp. SORGH_AS_0659]MDR6350848.1 hypothetical protein [Pantoea sp. SORGH_AS_0659]
MSIINSFVSSPEKLYSFIGAAAAVSIPLIVNTCKDFYFDYQKRKTEKNYIAVQLIYLLDDFVYQCGEVAWDQGYNPAYPEPEDYTYEAQVESPTFDMSSVKGEHKYLEPLMLYKLQSINVEIAKAKDTLREITSSPDFDHDSISYYFTVRRREFAEVGIKASLIADEIRNNFKVPYHDDWNPRETIILSLKNMNRQRAVSKIISMERRASRVMQKHRKQQNEQA